MNKKTTTSNKRKLENSTTTNKNKLSNKINSSSDIKQTKIISNTNNFEALEIKENSLDQTIDNIQKDNGQNGLQSINSDNENININTSPKNRLYNSVLSFMLAGIFIMLGVSVICSIIIFVIK